VTDDEKIAAIEAVLVENAGLLGEKQDIFLRRRPDGIRIQTKRAGRWVRGEYRHYWSIESAYQASIVANERAKRVAAGLATGASKEAAVGMAIHSVPAR
jgi:hypothetical protein